MKTTALKQYTKFILLPVLLVVAAILIIYLIINAPALWKKFDYYYITEIKHEEYSKPDAFLPDINSIRQQSKQENDLGDLQDNYLYIPKLNVSAPIIWQSSEDAMLDNLKNGVAHFGGSDTPDGPGNVFITGHSSYYWWVRSDYKNIFALLPKLEPGDIIIVTYRGEPFVYKVTETMTVGPKQTDIINSRGKRELTLMTCVPVGTSISRFVVKAELINKEATERAPSSSGETIELLPKVK